MKKITVLMVIVVIFSMAFSSCLQHTTEQPPNTNDIVAGIVNNDSPKEDTVEQIPYDTEEGSIYSQDNFETNLYASGGGSMEFQRYYPDELFSLYDLHKIVPWEKIYATDDWLSENHEYYYNEQLPPLYLMIKELCITKEEFVWANDDLSEEQIEIIFSDRGKEEIQRELKLDTAFLYKGRLYNVYELSVLDSTQLKEMTREGDLDEYISTLMKIASDMRIDSDITLERASNMLMEWVDRIKTKRDK